MLNINEYKENLRDTINNVKNLEILRNKNILITGASGLIGSAIVDTLIYANKNYKYNINIYVAGRNKEKIKVRFNESFNEKFFNYILYDATKGFDFNKQVEYIIHAASNAHPMAYFLWPVETMLSNFYGINNLLKYSKEKGVLRILYISSSEVYGQKLDNMPYTEEDYGFIDILNSRACYPSSKRASETLCASYKKEYDLDLVIVRPGHIYGPTMTEDDTRASAQFIRNAIKRKNIVMKSSGLQLRSYCYVFDCVSAILTVLLNGKSGEAYNISNKDSIVTIKDLAKAFAKSVGKDIIFENPSDVELKSANMMSNSSLDSSKLEKLGWRGLYNLEEGVRFTINILNNILSFRNL